MIEDGGAEEEASIRKLVECMYMYMTDFDKYINILLYF